MKSGDAKSAVVHYTKALAAEPPESAAFVAVLHAKRAAAYQVLGQPTKAIADCLSATALAPTYHKVLPTL